MLTCAMEAWRLSLLQNWWGVKMMTNFKNITAFFGELKSGYNIIQCLHNVAVWQKTSSFTKIIFHWEGMKLWLFWSNLLRDVMSKLFSYCELPQDVFILRVVMNIFKVQKSNTFLTVIMINKSVIYLNINVPLPQSVVFTFWGDLSINRRGCTVFNPHSHLI